MKRKPRNYWTIDICIKEALKYKRRSDFKFGYNKCYSTCQKNGWLNEVCSHMPKPKSVIGQTIFTKEYCWEKAKQYTSRTEFSEKEKRSYVVACKNGWVNEICSHMTSSHSHYKPMYYWDNKENIIVESKKYTSRIDFIKGSPHAYEAAHSRGLLDDKEIFGHMIQLGNSFNLLKMGYKMIFKSHLENYNNKEFIYIGFTGNFENRIRVHLNNKGDNLYPSICKYQLYCIDKFIYHKLINLHQAKINEKNEIKLMKQEGKYIILNQTKGGEGGTGAHRIWTKEKCEETYKYCKSVKECRSLNRIGYDTMKRMGWVIELFPNLEGVRKKEHRKNI